MCYATDECATVWNQTQVRARKQHTCRLCRLPIVLGTTHDRIGVLFDGRWTVYRVHSDCHALTKWIQLDVCKQDLYTLDADLRSEVNEHIDDHIEVRRRYRRMLRARIREGVWPEVRG